MGLASVHFQKYWLLSNFNFLFDGLWVTNRNLNKKWNKNWTNQSTFHPLFADLRNFSCTIESCTATVAFLCGVLEIKLNSFKCPNHGHFHLQSKLPYLLIIKGQNCHRKPWFCGANITRSKLDNYKCHFSDTLYTEIVKMLHCLK